MLNILVTIFKNIFLKYSPAKGADFLSVKASRESRQLIFN